MPRIAFPSQRIDHITIPSQQGKGVLRRVDEVLDCWFESGSMPYAQSHYPFENKEAWEKGFPADFIAEGLDQTRGWFYTLLVLSVHLFGKAPFKNVIVNGLVLAADGKKMSKRLKNYPEPTAIVDHYGADALRLYLINSPVVRAETLKFKEEDVKALLAQVFLPWFNSYRFFATQIVVLRKEFGVEFKYDPAAPTSPALMDRWILASCQSLIKFVRKEMEAYRLYTVVPRLLQLIDELTNWYLRFNRRRLKGENGPEDAVAAMNTLFEVLLTLCKTMSPFTPFITETIYQGLRPYLHSASGAAAAMCLDPKAADDRSIHFLSFPEPNERYSDPEIERRVARMRKVIELVRLVRDRKNIPVKTPLREVVVINADEEYLEDVRSLENYISEELNVKSVLVTSDELKYGVKYRADPDAKILGQRLKKDMPPVLKALKELPSDALKEFLTTKKLEVLGHALDENDVKVVRYFDEAEHPTYDGAFDKNALVLVDVTLDQGLIMEGMAREVVNRVQRLRKKVGLGKLRTTPISS